MMFVYIFQNATKSSKRLNLPLEACLTFFADIKK
jgi:hypothetical protein